MKPAVMVSNLLNQEGLVALMGGEVVALRVPNFYPEDICVQVAARMRRSDMYGRYVNAPEIARVGQAFFESVASAQLRRIYYARAVEWIREMRLCCEPYLSPIDKLRLVLDEIWPSGSRLGTLQGKKMFVGLARFFGAGVGAEPHQDVLAWDAPGVEEAERVEGQFAANIYLKMPQGGGDLLIWPMTLSREEYERAGILGSYGVHGSMLAHDPVRISPRTGELILFNSNLVHAVEKSRQGERVTWSCFVASQGVNQTLMMWS
ncbi:2OG-Fe(II) oxygenase [Sorangium sp. So ce726]|uniref:2OG-Fe(II) oxygenase n=1 Tax=Sorangium sp. So ce726 TaxID=3133319 RepID=UPI003F62F4B0